jgi:transposase
MSQPLRVRRLTDQEGQQIQRIVRRGGGDKVKSIVKWRRSMVILASAGGNSVEVIANLVQTSPDRVREMIHHFNEQGMKSLDPQWAGGRTRLITTDDRAFIVKIAKKRPRSLGQPFTRWSLRKLVKYLATKKHRKVKISRERLRQILTEEEITFQKTKTWKESPDPLKEEKLRRIDDVLQHHRDRAFAFDEFGPLTIKPVKGNCWSEKKKPQRLPANYHKHEGTRQFYACYSIGDDELWGTVYKAKSARSALTAIKSCRKQRPDGETIYVILDNLNSHTGIKLRTWCKKNNVELCFTPTYGSWANPIEAHFGPLREFVLNNSNYKNHRALSRAVHAYLRWRNANTRDPRILELERKHRLKMRSEAQRQWGHPKRKVA